MPPPPPPPSQIVIISMCVCFIFLFARSRIPIELQRTIAIAMNMEMLRKKRRYSAMTVNCEWTYDSRTQARGTALMACTVQSCTVFRLCSRCDTCFVYESTKSIHSSCQHIVRYITTGSTKALPVHGHEDRGGACQCVQLGQLDSEQKIPSVGSISGTFDRRFETNFASQPAASHSLVALWAHQITIQLLSFLVQSKDSVGELETTDKDFEFWISGPRSIVIFFDKCASRSHCT